MHSWQRRNAHLLFEWDVANYEKFESDSPEYIQKKKRLEFEKNLFKKFMLENDMYFKHIVSYLFLIVCVCHFLKLYFCYHNTTYGALERFRIFPLCSKIGLVIVQILMFAIYRIYISKKIFPKDELSATAFGDGTNFYTLVFSFNLRRFHYSLFVFGGKNSAGCHRLFVLCPIYELALQKVRHTTHQMGDTPYQNRPRQQPDNEDIRLRVCQQLRTALLLGLPSKCRRIHLVYVCSIFY